MAIEPTYHGEVRVVRSSYSSKAGPTLTLALHDIDELNKVQGMDGKRYMLALVEIGDDEQPVQPEKKKGGPLAILAGKWCQDPEFWLFISNSYPQFGLVTSSSVAAEAIRNVCGCKSRADLDHDNLAARIFHQSFRGPYIKWMAARGVITAPEYEDAV